MGLVGRRKYALIGDEEADHWAHISEVRGLFAAPDDESGWALELLGCAVEGKLLAATEHVGRRRAYAGPAWLELIGTEDTAIGSYFVGPTTVTSVRASAAGPGLLDIGVTVDRGAVRGTEWVWDLVRAGRLNRPGLWYGLDARGKQAWLSVALTRSGFQDRDVSDAPANEVYTLVGDAVTDIDGFYCALGEAINGPGGYFGWNLDALADCLCGGFGATWPFTLRWTRFEVADAHRAMAGDSGPDWVAVVLDLFQEQGIRVIRE